VQGNLDPVVLFADQTTIKEEVFAVLDAGRGAGHIFNLGHGVLPETPEANVKALVEMVREISSARSSH
jgi:uroporphyrinogen decarboxylase